MYRKAIIVFAVICIIVAVCVVFWENVLHENFITPKIIFAEETDQVVSESLFDPKILISDDEKIIIELNIPSIRISDVKQKGKVGSIIDIPGYSQTASPGKPQLPIRGFSLGIPQGAHPTIQILEKVEAIQQIGEIQPALRIRYKTENPDDQQQSEIETDFIYERDENIYSRNEYYPQKVVKLGKDGIMRDQRMISFQVCPIQYNPALKQIKHYKRLKIIINYNSSEIPPKSVLIEDTPAAFENVFKSLLLNYEIAKNWRFGRSGHLSKTLADNYFLTQGTEWCKLSLTEPGIYIVDKDDLDAVGFDLGGAVINNIKMFNKGEEIAIRVQDENTNNIFDSGDYIEFYGTVFKNYYTTTNIYWLTEGTSSGKRFVEKDGTPVGVVPTLIRGKESIHYEIDRNKFARFEGHESNDTWFTNQFYIPYINSRTYNVNLSNLSDTTTVDCRLMIRLVGASWYDNVNPDHTCKVTVNSNEIINTVWDGRIIWDKESEFNLNILQNGTNNIVFSGQPIPGTDYDWYYMDYFDLDYWRDYVAINDSLYFSSQSTGGSKLKLSGFVDSNIWIYDICDSNNVKQIVNYSFSDGTIYFQDNLSGDNHYLAVSPSKKKSVPTIEKYNNAGLRESSNQADYVMVCYEDFYEAALTLEDFHNNNGLNVKIAKTQEIYDEFNYGFYSDEAIKNFLSYIYFNWNSPTPTYVLLIGDASYNPRILSPGTYGADRSDFVPSHLFEAVEDNFEATSDNWFASVQGGDILPDYFIGRLTARSAEQARNMIDKIINYNTSFTGGDWNRTATFVADNAEAEEGLAFEDSSDAFINDLVPSTFTVKRAYLSVAGSASATKAAINNAVNEGTLVLNYYGHGSVGTWAAERIYTREDVPGLRNDNNAPFILTLSCINGYFIEPSDANHALAEAFFRERQRGAIAVFSGSGEAYPSPVLSLGRKIYKTLFQDHNLIVGSFSTVGLIEMHSRYPDLYDHLMFYILFGDPASKIHYVPSENYLSSAFEGTVLVNNIVAPENTDLLADIADKTAAKGKIYGNKGSFGPIYIDVDDPATPNKDGAVAGDTIHFKAVISIQDTIALYPIAVIKPGVQKLNLTNNKTNIEEYEKYNIDYYVNEKQVGIDFFDGDPVSKKSLISAVLKSTTLEIDPTLIKLRINNETLSDNKYTIIPDAKMQNYSVNIYYSPEQLEDGHYKLSIDLENSETQAVLQNEGVSFTIQSILKIDDIMNYPNPLTESTHFSFSLANDKSCQTEIKIYSIAGRLIRTIDIGMAEVGFNHIYWDGNDDNGDPLANGVYLYKIIARDENEKVEKLERLIVMR